MPHKWRAFLVSHFKFYAATISRGTSLVETASTSEVMCTISCGDARSEGTTTKSSIGDDGDTNISADNHPPAAMGRMVEASRGA